MNKKGYTILELVIVLAAFSIIYFVGASVVAKDFNVDFYNDLYKQKIAAIEKDAVIYSTNKEDFFKENNTVYMTIEQLAKENVIINTTEGVVVDPRDDNKVLNDLKVKIENKDGTITAKVLV